MDLVSRLKLFEEMPVNMSSNKELEPTNNKSREVNFD